jgi:signal transduction histidine kinase
LPTVIIVVVSVLSCVSLMWRRRFPVALTVVLIVASVWVPAVSGASMVAMFTAAVRRKLPTVLLLVLLATASAMAQIALGYTAGQLGYWLAVAGTVLLCLLVVGWGIAVRSRRELVLLMAERLHRLEAEQESRLREARQAVRDGIARDLHDSLAHRLTLISMSTGALEYRGSVPPDEFQDMIEILRSNARHGLSELREVVTVLRRPDGQAVPGQHPPDGVISLIAEARAAGQKVDADWTIPPDRLTAGRADSLYRSVQEGLSNARKHASDQRVALLGRLERDGTLRVEMINAIEPRTCAGPGGSGLAGLTDRVGAEGGSVCTSSADGFFRLQVTWPPAPSANGSRRDTS